MIQHVQERGWASGADRVIVATDDERVAAAARDGGGEALLTREDHATGTDRIAEVAGCLEMADDAILVNLQGDEPLMPPALLRCAAEDLAAHPDASIATLATPIGSETLDNPNEVKVVFDHAGYALYFSRAPIPWPRDGVEAPPVTTPWRRHLGIYAYRARFLRRFPTLAVPTLEEMERLEQLRALWHGYRIHITTVDVPPEAGVDTPEDLDRVAARMSNP
jgi:3-deoxy-manno-octulosonate cytidylyltransferase (CMP-KDO synthetase)